MRLTWKEIQNQYPNQRVGLINIEWEKGRIVSAEVKYSECDLPASEISERALRGEVFSQYTAPDSMCQVGGLSIMCELGDHSVSDN